MNYPIILARNLTKNPKKGLLVYRMDVRCQNRPPTVRDAFSKALGGKNRRLWYGRDIRYQNPPLLWYATHLRCANSFQYNTL